MEFLQFIFSSFWVFLGFIILSIVALTAVKYLFDFFVELIHGKAPLTINQERKMTDEELRATAAAKALEKAQKKEAKRKAGDSGFDSTIKMDISEVKSRGPNEKD